MTDTLTAAWIEGEAITLAGVAQGRSVFFDLPADAGVTLAIEILTAHRQRGAFRAADFRAASGAAAPPALTTDDPYPDRVGADGE